MWILGNNVLSVGIYKKGILNCQNTECDFENREKRQPHCYLQGPGYYWGQRSYPLGDLNWTNIF